MRDWGLGAGQPSTGFYYRYRMESCQGDAPGAELWQMAAVGFVFVPPVHIRSVGTP